MSTCPNLSHLSETFKTLWFKVHLNILCDLETYYTIFDMCRLSNRLVRHKFMHISSELRCSCCPGPESVVGREERDFASIFVLVPSRRCPNGQLADQDDAATGHSAGRATKLSDL